MHDKSTKDKSKRRSGHVVTTLLAAAAAATVGGCAHNSTTARCVGPDGRVLADAACQGSGGSGYVGGGGYAGGYAYGRQARWVYGGGGGSAIGSRATGYSTTAPSEGDISTHSGTVIRGGFGGEGGGGEGDGGGHGGGGE